MLKIYMGGSPCTHWSIAQTKDRETEPSGLGWELFKNYLIGLEKYAPDYFLYENNKSMPPSIRAQITKELGVEPILINSTLVSAQNRQRLYWTNIPGVTQPEDRGILLRDVLETGMAWRGKAYTLDANYCRTDGTYNPKKQHSYSRLMVAEPVRIGTIESAAQNADFDSQQYRVYSPNGKGATLCGNVGGVGAKTGLYATPCRIAELGTSGGQGQRVYSIDAKAPHVRAEGRQEMIGEPAMRVREATRKGHVDILPGDCVDMTQPNSKTRRGRSMKRKSNCVMTSCQYYQYCGTIDRPIYEVRDGLITIKDKQYPIKLMDGYYIIRKLTVLECKRLQTVPDSYIFPVSDTQVYKMLGNGWTVDVVAHILSFVPGITTQPIEVLSMYDGMSCGHIALDKLGANVQRYYATEIDKFAIQTAQHNYPDTVQLGDAGQVRDDGWCVPRWQEKRAEGDL